MDNIPVKNDFRVDQAFDNLMNELSDNRPNDRSEKDKFYSIVITEIQKAYGLFFTYILTPNDDD